MLLPALGRCSHLYPETIMSDRMNFFLWFTLVQERSHKSMLLETVDTSFCLPVKPKAKFRITAIELVSNTVTIVENR